MADRKAIQLQDGAGNVYDIKDAAAQADITELKSAITQLDERTEYPDLLNGWDTIDYENGFITSSGTVTQSNDYRSTTFIAVSEGDAISYKLKGYLSTVWIITAYDSTKNRIAESSVQGETSFLENVYTVGAGTKYVRLSSGLYAQAQFWSNTVFGTSTTPIKEYLADELPKKLNIQQNASDAGKLLGIGQDGSIEAKTVQTEIADNSITYDKLQKSVIQIQQSIVNFWYYNNEKRTDGKSIEVIVPLNTIAYFEYPS